MAYTGGRVTATIAYDNELKITSAEMPRAAQELRIAGGDAFAGALAAIDPVFGLPSLPFVVQSVDVAQSVNARARPLYEKALQSKGLKLLYLTIWPSTGIWSDSPLATPDDLRRLAIRTYDTSSTEVMRAAGASPELLPLNDAVAALREHRLNAFLTSGDGGAGRKLWDYLHHFTPVNYAMPVSLAFVRIEAFEALSDDLRKQVMAAAAETERSQFELLANRTTENHARMRANGVDIADPAPAPVVAALRQAAAEPLAAWKARVNRGRDQFGERCEPDPRNVALGIFRGHLPRYLACRRRGERQCGRKRDDRPDAERLLRSGRPGRAERESKSHGQCAGSKQGLRTDCPDRRAGQPGPQPA
jgi:TRAP-type transport system periplasmic protein